MKGNGTVIKGRVRVSISTQMEIHTLAPGKTILGRERGCIKWVT
jgi:hypothetical protein